MDAVTLSRIQFGTTIVYHFLIVPLTLGLVVLVALMETLYVRSGNVVYKRMAQFWGKLFLINFALGVMTGIVQEFQFGMNWSTYSRFIGDVFGAPLAIEGLLAFFMESTFLGIWLFGWDRLPKLLHLGSIWLVALGSYLSAFWILIANSFMQQPVGYIVKNGRAEMNNFLALLTNPTLWVQFPHVVAASITTGAFFVIGISAYHLIRKSSNQDAFQRSMRIGMIVAVIGSLTTALAGDLEAKHLAVSQPMKLASAEALWHTEDPAGLSIISVIDEQHHDNPFAIRIPAALSFLVHDSFSGQVQGIDELQAQYVKQFGPGNYIPPVVISFWGFRLMVGVALLLAATALYGLYLQMRKRLTTKRWFLWVLVGSIALPYVANTAGWILTEMGRQPWLVFGVLTTSAGVSPNVGTGMILFTLISFIVLYAILAVVDGMLLTRTAKKGIEEPVEQPDEQTLVLAY